MASQHDASLLPAVCQALNKLPEAQHGTDIMRVREPLLAGQGALYRQTIVLSSFTSAEMNALLNRACFNWAGKIKLRATHQVQHRPLLQYRKECPAQEHQLQLGQYGQAQSTHEVQLGHPFCELICHMAPAMWASARRQQQAIPMWLQHDKQPVKGKL